FPAEGKEQLTKNRWVLSQDVSLRDSTETTTPGKGTSLQFWSDNIFIKRFKTTNSYSSRG
ncbi:hypothetical protein, partial [Salmonella sp. SAL4431]|uniref:hypothetical protein n=1 Tax=Salmonella sp. SAL4431 TaxID=3159886 RepID=UPI00397A1AB3